MRSHKDATTDCQPRVTSINDELNSSEAIFIGAGSKAGPVRVFNHGFVPVIATLAGLATNFKHSSVFVQRYIYEYL